MGQARDNEQASVASFGHRWAADRYARGRPYFHPIVIGKVHEALALHEPVKHALDVGCGTGLSTLALRAIATTVVSVDPSPEILSHAPSDAGLHFVAASAEYLPFAPDSFELISVSSAFHWFDRTLFLAEAHRLLHPSSWLVVFDNAFRGVMDENPHFRTWIQEAYLARYPTPPRDRRPLTTDEAKAHGFHFVDSEKYVNTISFSPDELVDYLMTQSNAIAAVAAGREHTDEIREWLLSSVLPLFAGPRGSFQFSGAIWYLQKR